MGRRGQAQIEFEQEPLEAMTRLPDKLFRIFYKFAYVMMRVFCFVFRPRTRGVCVAVRFEDKVLIIKNSYHHKHTLPGGYVKRGERPRLAAVRELKEEVGLEIRPEQLSFELKVPLQIEFKRELMTFFDLKLARLPLITIDKREVIGARFVALEEALALDLSGPCRLYLKKFQNR